jgi:hypothetical protein
MDDLICLASSLDRSTLLEQFRTYPARFPIDFTPEFLGKLSLDQLRHIFVAMCMQNDRWPDVAARAA